MAKNQTLKWLLGAGLLLATVAAFLPQFSWGVWFAVVLGLIGGYMMKGDVKLFLAALILGSFSTTISLVPTVGNFLATLFQNWGYFAFSIAAIPALRVMLGRAGIKI